MGLTTTAGAGALEGYFFFARKAGILAICFLSIAMSFLEPSFMPLSLSLPDASKAFIFGDILVAMVFFQLVGVAQRASLRA